VALLVALTARCSDDDDMSTTPDANLTGLWTLTADGFSPPTRLACNGGHSTMAGQPLCFSFNLDLALTGGSYSGSSTQTYCGADWSAVIVVNGNDLSGEIVSDDGTDVQRFTFSGTASGTTATIVPLTFSEDGLSGNCTMSGFYDAAL
jgi:hypothetical protein